MMISTRALENPKKSARYYKLDGFDGGSGKNVAAGKKLKSARGPILLVNSPNVKFTKLSAVRDELYAFGNNNALYYVDGLKKSTKKYDVAFTDAPVFCRVFDGEDYVTVLSDGTNVYFHDKSADALSPLNGIPPFKIACYAYERLWLYNGGTIYFSAPLDYSDFTVGKNGAGEILVPDGKGEVLALIPFDNRVYIFRENGIQRFDVRGEQTAFKITDCVELSEKIVKDTIAVGDDRIYFATEASIYKLAVSGVSRVYAEYFKNNALTAISAAYAEGGYFLVATDADGVSLNIFKDDGVEKINADISGVVSFCKDGTYTPYVCSGGIIYTLGNTASQFANWKSDFLDLGQGAREKVLERVKIRGTGDFTLTVESGARSRKFAVIFKNGVADVPVAMSGDYFRFTLEIENAGGEIDELSCLYTLSKGGKL